MYIFYLLSLRPPAVSLEDPSLHLREFLTVWVIASALALYKRRIEKRKLPRMAEPLAEVNVGG